MNDHSGVERYRAAFLKDLHDELFGPTADDPPERQAESIDHISPLGLYGAGVLFPQESLHGQLDDGDDPSSGSDLDDAEGELERRVAPNSASRRAAGSATDDRPEEQPLNLANEYNPSAVGISFRVDTPCELGVGVSYGAYVALKATEPHPKRGEPRSDGTLYPATREISRFKRTPVRDEFSFEVTGSSARLEPIDVGLDEHALRAHVRWRVDRLGRATVSVTLVNQNMLAGSKPSVRNTFFQVRFEVASVDLAPVFRRIDRAEGYADDEMASLDLLYRDRQAFALGHGCAGDWTGSPHPDRALMVFTAAIPAYDLKPIKPRVLPYRANATGLSLSMAHLSGAKNDELAVAGIIESLTDLADDYESWIRDRQSEAEEIGFSFRATAIQHVGAARECLERMRTGIRMLESDSAAMLAFRLANRAMLIQQLRASLPARPLGSEYPRIDADYSEMPGQERRWRPFQLAFILMNIAGTIEEDHPDRELVDLIWFPTGGGKTEAYLGLAAFVVCLRRLRDRSDDGTTVLMRYTLRLLTAQQFQRATALILAIEVLRQDRYLGADLGSTPISIGLWVGKSLSPNDRGEATASLRRMSKPGRRKKHKPENPFQVLSCPWCGLEWDNTDNLGYVLETLRPGVRAPVFRCPDNHCRWGDQNVRLPVRVVDEDIYEEPPTLVVGTVDKFAQVTWRSEVGRLFGVDRQVSPPGLIIQDELHLISGPLGTIVGSYEAAIDRLCSKGGVSAKIVASTATIRSSGDQCSALYNRACFEFPPSGLNAGDSYFAFEDQDAPGRLYVGVFASGLSSHATAQVRTCSRLLQAVRSLQTPEGVDHDEVVDHYGTLVWYFNTLRELGHAETLCAGDIFEYLKAMCLRRGIDWKLRRRIPVVEELTSRKTADEIPDILRQLERRWTEDPTPGSYPVDVLLATNMISVGLDISRLGLMVVNGQPKSTSEYIQATSRVGRSAPGMVVTIYNQSKVRDRSHYEQFRPYHQSMYRYVEPTSLTPFSAPARERALRGVMIALARQKAGVETPDDIEVNIERVREELRGIVSRVQAIDALEADATSVDLETWLSEWIAYAPHEYGSMGGRVDTATLAYAYGTIPQGEFHRHSWPVLTSMRNVDGTCVARVIRRYLDEPRGLEED